MNKDLLARRSCSLIISVDQGPGGVSSTWRRPDLVRRLVLAAGNPGGAVPGLPPAGQRVRTILSGPEVGGDDMVYLSFADTEAGRAAGHEYLARVAGRLANGRPELSPLAADGQAAAIAANASVPLEQMRANLDRIPHPVLVTAGLRDVVTPALTSFILAQHLPNATLLGYGDAGHAFPFQRAKQFAAQVTTFLAYTFQMTRPPTTGIQ